VLIKKIEDSHYNDSHKPYVVFSIQYAESAA